MMGHKICFKEEKWIPIPKLSLLALLIWSTETVTIDDKAVTELFFSMHLNHCK